MATPSEALQKERKLLEQRLTVSPTAYARGADPSRGDLRTSTQLASVNQQIDALRSQETRLKWYGAGDSKDDAVAPPDGVFMGALKALQRPMNAIMGVGQYALGKGSESTLVANVNKAMKSGLTAGNILNQYGVPRGVQVPLGFALDVMFDPINWGTAGVAALIPRIGIGAMKGGLKGASVGLTSNIARKAATTMKFVPFAGRSAKYSGIRKGLGEKALSGAKTFDEIIGRNIYDKLGKGVFGARSGLIGETAESIIRGKTVTPGLGFLNKAAKIPMYSTQTVGDKFADFFKYSTKQASDMADLKDKVIKLATDKGAILVRSEAGADFKSIDDFLSPDASISLKSKTGDSMEIAIREADGSIKKDYIGQVKVYDNITNAKKLLESATEDYNLRHLVLAYKETPAGKTGVKWYDDKIDKLKNTTLRDIKNRRLGPIILKEVEKDADELVKAWNSYDRILDMKPLNKLLKAQEELLAFFKSAKVPMNISSHVVAYIGNFFMGAMMGLPVQKAKYIASLKNSNKLVRGKLGASSFKEMFYAEMDSLINMADNNPTRFKQLTGLNPREVASKLSKEEQITQVLRPSSEIAEVKKVLGEAIDRIEAGLKQGEDLSKFEKSLLTTTKVEKISDVNKQLLKEKAERFQTPSESIAKMLKEAPIRRSEEFGSWTTGEIASNVFLSRIKEETARLAVNNPNNYMYKAADAIVNAMPRGYEQIDQTFKLGTANYLTKVGLTEQELIRVSRTVPITKADILDTITSEGEKYYKLTQLKAADIATEAYMNYSAMPDFVRVMRALPIVGSPFFSFPFAMALKTVKTTINNPALFNKVGAGINEMNAGRTPLEKYAMEEKYNTYLKSPSVVKIGGMWNTNVKNFIPYFTLNMFQPSERTYEDSVGGNIMKVFDKTPLFQDPAGAVLRDYFIQPWVLSNYGRGETPQGQFGQPLFPSYDEKGKPIKPSLRTKVSYAGRTLAESLVPGTLSYLGLPLGLLGMSPSAINYIPSYGARNLANATRGRSTIGTETKEDAVRKTMRSVFGRTGFPLYTLDTTKTSIKK